VKEVPQEIKQSMIKLSNTLFAFDKFNLSNEAIVELDKVVKWLTDNPKINVEIEGHTDNIGTAAYNKTLSESRSKSVHDYFVSHGVAASRLSYRGYGFDRPVATNATAEGRQENRRVELKITN
jgi:outer membrane protein OmpA-like peptidoglycan-associated protein